MCQVESHPLLACSRGGGEEEAKCIVECEEQNGSSPVSACADYKLASEKSKQLYYFDEGEGVWSSGGQSYFTKAINIHQ